MKRFLFIAAIAAPIFWTACSGDPKTTELEDVVPPGMKAIHLTSLGFPVKINIPDSTFYPIVDSSETPNGVRLKIGQHFDLFVNTAGTEESDITKMKAVIEAGSELPKTFSKMDSTSLVWEEKIGDLSMNHFFMLIKTANGTYYVRDNSIDADNPFTAQEVEKMMATAKSVRPIAAAKPPES
jgi:hypothetical protein